MEQTKHSKIYFKTIKYFLEWNVTLVTFTTAIYLEYNEFPFQPINIYVDIWLIIVYDYQKAYTLQ